MEQPTESMDASVDDLISEVIEKAARDIDDLMQSVDRWEAEDETTSQQKTDRYLQRFFKKRRMFAEHSSESSDDNTNKENRNAVPVGEMPATDMADCPSPATEGNEGDDSYVKKIMDTFQKLFNNKDSPGLEGQDDDPGDEVEADLTYPSTSTAMFDEPIEQNQAKVLRNSPTLPADGTSTKHDPVSQVTQEVLKSSAITERKASTPDLADSETLEKTSVTMAQEQDDQQPEDSESDSSVSDRDSQKPKDESFFKKVKKAFKKVFGKKKSPASECSTDESYEESMQQMFGDGDEPTEMASTSPTLPTDVSMTLSDEPTEQYLTQEVSPTSSKLPADGTLSTFFDEPTEQDPVSQVTGDVLKSSAITERRASTPDLPDSPSETLDTISLTTAQEQDDQQPENSKSVSFVSDEETQKPKEESFFKKTFKNYFGKKNSPVSECHSDSGESLQEKCGDGDEPTEMTYASPTMPVDKTLIPSDEPTEMDQAEEVWRTSPTLPADGNLSTFFEEQDNQQPEDNISVSSDSDRETEKPKGESFFEKVKRAFGKSSDEKKSPISECHTDESLTPSNEPTELDQAEEVLMTSAALPADGTLTTFFEEQDNQQPEDSKSVSSDSDSQKPKDESFFKKVKRAFRKSSGEKKTPVSDESLTLSDEPTEQDQAEEVWKTSAALPADGTLTTFFEEQDDQKPEDSKSVSDDSDRDSQKPKDESFFKKLKRAFGKSSGEKKSPVSDEPTELDQAEEVLTTSAALPADGTLTTFFEEQDIQQPEDNKSVSPDSDSQKPKDESFFDKVKRAFGKSSDENKSPVSDEPTELDQAEEVLTTSAALPADGTLKTFFEEQDNQQPEDNKSVSPDSDSQKESFFKKVKRAFGKSSGENKSPVSDEPTEQDLTEETWRTSAALPADGTLTKFLEEQDNQQGEDRKSVSPDSDSQKESFFKKVKRAFGKSSDENKSPVSDEPTEQDLTEGAWRTSAALPAGGTLTKFSEEQDNQQGEDSKSVSPDSFFKKVKKAFGKKSPVSDEGEADSLWENSEARSRTDQQSDSYKSVSDSDTETQTRKKKSFFKKMKNAFKKRTEESNQNLPGENAVSEITSSSSSALPQAVLVRQEARKRRRGISYENMKRTFKRFDNKVAPEPTSQEPHFVKPVPGVFETRSGKDMKQHHESTANEHTEDENKRKKKPLWKCLICCSSCCLPTDDLSDLFSSTS